MSKNTEVKLVGQPIFSQVLKLIDKWEFSKLVKEHKTVLLQAAKTVFSFRSITHR